MCRCLFSELSQRLWPIFVFVLPAFPPDTLLTTAVLAEDPAITVPPGFQVQHFADDDLAHDIHSLTIDARGRVVVSGPGYIRILVDSNNDGQADEYLTFADTPAAGAQGMCFMGPHLLCSGDDGLQIFRDDDGDNQADGPADTFLKMRTGAEHHAHAIQKGPDGWWYIIAGNNSGIDGSYANLLTSPIKNPEAGVLMRLRPDLSAGEVVSDGLRNAYDFAFSELGDVFTFDSDGERDVSLPWYVPCRVLQLTPGGHAGWVSRSWKRPGDFPDTTPVLAEFGRGSPTGMVCYRHEQFSSRYKGAIFALDWSFGRILVLSLESGEGLPKANAAVFAKASGEFGFAPTDMAVAPDGSLYVSVGGRGTRGSVYRIYHTEGARRTPSKPVIGETQALQLSYVLNAPQPQSSWSRASWHPVARVLGEEIFVLAAIDERLRPVERVRAIEILTDVFDGLTPATVTKLTAAKSAIVRARAAWAIGRSQPDAKAASAMQKFLSDRDPVVVRAALEALGSVTDQSLQERCLPQLAVALSSTFPAVRSAATAVVANLQDDQALQLQTLAEGHLRAQVRIAFGQMARKRTFRPKNAELALRVVRNPAADFQEKADALRLMQLAMGDVGPGQDVSGMFESYTAGVSLTPHQSLVNSIRSELEQQFPAGNVRYDRELIRTLAMLGTSSEVVLERLLSCITSESSPTEDLHCLAALARNTASRTPQWSAATALALVSLELKIQQREMKQDSNWDDRVAELYAELCQVDPAIAEVIGDQTGFGQPGHVLFLKLIAAERTQTAIDGFAKSTQATDDYKWSSDVVFVIGRSSREEHKQLVREQLNNLAVRDAVLVVLSRDAETADRAIYLEGLNSPQRRVVEASIAALTTLPRSNDAAEQYKLHSAARRLNNGETEFALREGIIRLLENNSGQNFGFIFGKQGHSPQQEALGRIQSWLEHRYPDFVPAEAAEKSTDQLMGTMNQVDWQSGDASRGKAVFLRLSCARCHGGRAALGPDLKGIGKRFSRDDMFAAIVDPDRDISQKYQMTTVQTKAGKVYSGLITYESVDGLILRDSDHKTYRLEAIEIEARTRTRRSLMPSGLLRNASHQELADLYAYLREM